MSRSEEHRRKKRRAQNLELIALNRRTVFQKKRDQQKRSLDLLNRDFKKTRDSILELSKSIEDIRVNPSCFRNLKSTRSSFALQESYSAIRNRLRNEQRSNLAKLKIASTELGFSEQQVKCENNKLDTAARELRASRIFHTRTNEVLEELELEQYYILGRHEL